jgi:adenosylcobinamide-phosphate synthase
MSITLIIFSALLLDFWLGEPRRFHPLVGFGNLAKTVERWLYADNTLSGLTAVLLLLIPFTLVVTLTQSLSWHWALDILLLYLAIGWKSLGIHAKRVQSALLADNLPDARHQVSMLVSRDTTQLDQGDVAKATIESVLENGNDAIFATLFWFVVAGAPGAIAYRLVNTLDAMWGYRNNRYQNFGWAAARLDDVLNYIPARLTALSYAITGQMQCALHCWKTQGHVWKSPNAGPVMAAGAGSLGVSLGGAAWYHGKLEQRPILGEGRDPNANDIDRAILLIQRAIVLWLVFICLGEELAQRILFA